ncbi:hypothetical protein OTU49_002449, partial [Cherax quadricarinatus]
MTDHHRISRVGLLDPAREGPFSLDAALLLRHLPPTPAVNRVTASGSGGGGGGGGFDNVGFDLESLGEVKAGCRRPLMSVQGRTLFPEEHVLSSLCRQPKSLPPTPVLSTHAHRSSLSQQAKLGGSVSVIQVSDDNTTHNVVFTSDQTRHAADKCRKGNTGGKTEKKDVGDAGKVEERTETVNVQFKSVGVEGSPCGTPQKTSASKKTACGKEVCGGERGSVRETMVEAGGGTRPSAATSVSVAGTTRMPASARVSRSGAPTSSVSSVVFCAAPTPAPTVSALTKVSSVRIVPTPTPTPTPSISGHDTPTHQARGSQPAAPRPAPRPPRPGLAR